MKYINKILLNLSTGSNAFIFFILLAFTVIALFLVLANPGYFSHDEFQKLDHIQRHGFADYVFRYVRIAQGDAFGTPVRPLAFLIQGILAFAMDDFPFLVHFAAIAMHVLVAYLFFRATVQMGGSKSLGLLAAFLFIINPMTTLATAWSAALMDRLYIIFGLLALLAADQYIKKNGNLLNLLYIFVFSSLAIFSKETAIILPGLLLLFLIIDLNTIKLPNFWHAMAAWTAPVITFILLRLPAIIASFGQPKISAYKASLDNAPEGVLVYIAYPFLPTLTEANNWIFQSSGAVIFAVFLHALLLITLLRVFGYKAAVAYCIFYLMFLLPVLMIPIKAAHYMYASGLALSLAVAAVLLQTSNLFIYRVITIVGIFVLLAHTMALQVFVYRLGSCMTRAYTSTESTYLSNTLPTSINFQAVPGAPEHVLHRLFTGRNQIGNSSPVSLTISKWGTPVDSNTLSVVMNSRCIVSKK
ncbi:MAG: hypothetical protein Q7U52_12810 [Hydrogenophaga sp.]|nr:hypothetical protein [Hydrogenophaga sp.]